jgi:hypothetical protein
MTPVAADTAQNNETGNATDYNTVPINKIQ